MVPRETRQGSSRVPARFLSGYIVLLGLALLSSASYLGWQLAQRSRFPWDLFIWSESPFLTNMIKLVRGAGIYTAPEQANSFVYSFGLEWLTLLLLAPFNLELDIPAARSLCIALGMLACVAGAVAMGRVAGPCTGLTGAMLRVTGFCALMLTLAQSVTFGAIHPDNLHILHAVTTLTLGLIALQRNDLRIAYAAMLWAGLGVLTKQTGAVAFIGIGAAFIWARAWPMKTLASLLAMGGLVSLLSLALLWWPTHARFWTLDLLLLHPFDPGRLEALWQDVTAPWRMILLLAGPAALAYLYGRSQVDRSFVQLWLCTFLVSCAPNLLAYFKQLGLSNNLGIIDFWLMLAVWPTLLRVAAASTEGAADMRQLGGSVTALLGASALGLFLWQPYAHPNEQDYAFGQRLESRLRSDYRAGCTTLVDNNTAAWLRAGNTVVPLDRINTYNNMRAGGIEDQAGTRARLANGYYDRVYVLWRQSDLPALLAERYTLAEQWKGTGARDRERGLFGITYRGVQVWERKTASAESVNCSKP